MAFLQSTFHRYRNFASLSLLLLTAVAVGAQAPAKSAQPQFEHGKQLIEKNCLDCMGSTKKGMEDGLREVLAAMQAGFRDQLAAYKLLSEAYGAMAVFSEQTDPKESHDYWQKRADAMKKLYALDPDDPEIAEEYVYTLTNDAEKISILRGIVKKHPSYTPASFVLGLLFIGSNNFAEGIHLISDAISKENGPEDELNYVERLLAALNEQGCPVTDEAKWLEEASGAFGADSKATGDPTALPLFKKKFLNVMDGFECKRSTEAAKPPRAGIDGQN